ncbi:MAG: DUF1549 domain-containing protein [Pirellulales bacterium]
MTWFPLALIIAVVGQGPVDANYQRDIRPLFAQKCAACHSALRQEAGLRLDAGSLILQGSESGPVLVPGSATTSRLMQRVSGQDPDLRMPPPDAGEGLDAKQVALLSAWIDAGAQFPSDESIPADPRDHWAYQVPRRPRLSANEAKENDVERTVHPIDALLQLARGKLGVKPVRQADRATLLRRVYFDLIGLPPTAEEYQAFQQDDSADAWRRVVDRLLASPHYGERWGRHWMDVWRYSDWEGYKEQLRGSQRHIWHWRDWIVRSLNADKGYDRMITDIHATLLQQMGLNPRQLVVPGRKRLERDFGRPIHEIIA